MKLVLSLLEEFGPHLADGEEAASFRLRRIEPYISLGTEIVVDFSGVRNANSSFVNALVAGVVEQHGERVLDQLIFKGCNPVIRVLVETAIDLGLRKTHGRIDA
jgi:anti-anti-sigma regulatory factor